MKCGFCNAEFTEEEAVESCKNCIMGGNCGRIKCPKCSYENYKEIEFNILKKFKNWRDRDGKSKKNK